MTTDAQSLISDVGRFLADSLAQSISDGIDTIGSMGMSRRCGQCGRKRSECQCQERCRKVTGPRGPSSCGCEIPPPCWYPRHAGDVRSYAREGGEAILRIRVHNGAPASAAFTIDCDTEEGVEIESATFSLGPMSRRTVVIKVKVTEHEQELLVWVRGCHDHYIRWTVRESCRCRDACHEIDVDDAPDYLHHWYDHFYCQHPCPGTGARALVAAGHGV